MKAIVKYKVIYRHREKYSISEMCRIFGVSRSGYYDYVKRMDLPEKELPLAEKIRECQAECRSTYGYRRVQIWLERRGIHRNPKTVLRSSTPIWPGADAFAAAPKVSAEPKTSPHRREITPVPDMDIVMIGLSA